MRVALVTGAAHGIGASIAERLLTDGWHVVAADPDAEALSRLAPHPQRRVQTSDIADPTAITSLVDGIAQQEGRLDALVSNAGFMIRKMIYKE